MNRQERPTIQHEPELEAHTAEIVHPALKTMYTSSRPPEAPLTEEAGPGQDASVEATSTSSRMLVSEEQLGRRWSTPARLKTAKTNANCQKSLNHKESNKLRHSHRDKSTNYDSQNTDDFRHRSISLLRPTSSSASDSAFSQSQTTLGTDSETLNRFSSDSPSKCGDNDGGSSTGDVASGIPYSDRDHFGIVWQNLSYKIPEKRFNRLVALASKVKTKWGALKNSTEPPADRSRNTENGSDPTCGCHHDIDRLEDGLAPSSGHLDQYPALINRQRQMIFSSLNGCVKSGQLTAILGPSGAGKTTFLKCLTSDITKGVSGSITIHNLGVGSGNGGDPPLNIAVPFKSSQQHLKLCIIPQKDYLFDNLTVMENLLFASRIKNTQPQDFDHKANVYRVANLLGLQPCMKLKTSRLSGGQYKRVSIAQELLSQPDILILDEPTSGLDSLTCFRTVSVLRDLADMSQAGLLKPLAIIMTIHQPQIKIFNLFHHVYILSSLGQCVYEGRPDYLVDTVADRCKLLPPPDDQNPASFIIDLASEVYGPKPINSLIELHQENFAIINTKSEEATSCAESCDKINNLPAFLGPDEFAKYPPKCCSVDKQIPGEHLYISEQLRKRRNNDESFWLHTGLLIKRLWISMWRDSLLTTTRITFHLIIPFVFYFVYSQKSGHANACPHVERELDIQDMVSDSNIERLTTQHDELILTFENVSLFFLLLYSFSMCVLAVTALSFPLNMQILLKETTNGWYTMPRFVMAKTLADLPMELTMPMISVSIAYSLTGQPSSYMCWRMLSVTAIMTVCSLISQTQGLLFGAYFMNNVQAAVFISQASTLPWIMLSGFTTRVSQLPKVLQWLSFGSIYRLGIESIVSVRYGYGMCPCDTELVNDTPPKIIGIPDQLRSLMSYYMGVYSDRTDPADAGDGQAPSNIIKSVIASSRSNSTSTNSGDIFEKIASTLVRANTYGADIVSCSDVRPFIMSAREVDESTLPIFLSILVTVLLCLRVLLFFVVRIRTG